MIRRKRRKGRGLDKRDEGKTKKWGRRRGGIEGCTNNKRKIFNSS
jgi:hypothetical protein